jgi:Tfp pilus assembly protein FimV
VLEATEENSPPHFHVAVFPAPYARYVAARGGPSFASAGNYKVRSGDSLWAIARRNDTTVDRLKQINGLSSSLLRPGQTLKLPE